MFNKTNITTTVVIFILIPFILSCSAHTPVHSFNSHDGLSENSISGNFHLSAASAEATVLYLYFPSAEDSNVPEWGDPYGISTSPVAVFDVADLDSSIGTTNNLIDGILEMVKVDYFEFNVNVFQSTSLPNPTSNQWQIVSIGTDSETYSAIV